MNLRREISFHFHPFEFESKGHAVQKADSNGKKRRYLYGVASGSKTDAEGERLTDNCIQSINNQATSGHVLLMSDLHGKGSTEDIGYITDSKILENGDWWIEAMLFDESDGVPEEKLGQIDTLWKQVNGLPPYKRPLQKGFSIEGWTTDILETNQATGARVINDMEIDYVAVVPRPAYNDSIAHAIAKALGSRTTGSLKNQIGKMLIERLEKENERDNYGELRWNLDAAFDGLIEEIMASDSIDKGRELGVVLDEYKIALINLLMQNEAVFKSRGSTDDSEAPSGDALIAKAQKMRERIQRIQSLVKTLKEQKNGK